MHHVKEDRLSTTLPYTAFDPHNVIKVATEVQLKKKKKEIEKNDNLDKSAVKKTKQQNRTRADCQSMIVFVVVVVILQNNIYPVGPVGTSSFHSPGRMPAAAASLRGIQRCTMKPC